MRGIGNLHEDFAQRVLVDSKALAWQASASETVWCKRLESIGPSESARETSIVRCDAGASFPEHDHPKGEEILVLDGVYCDRRGEFGAGTYLLHPDGFTHAPFSREGCTLFVKQRQYAGADRPLVHIDTTSATYTPLANAVHALLLSASQEHGENIRLVRMHAGSRIPEEEIPRGREVYVIDGVVTDTEGTYPEGSWLRLPAGGTHQLRALEASTLYVRDGVVLEA